MGEGRRSGCREVVYLVEEHWNEVLAGGKAFKGGGQRWKVPSAQWLLSPERRVD